jgi:hypothetical protein
MSEHEMKSFEEFWPYYVAEHSRQGTRALHYAGTLTGLACVAAFVVRGKWKLLPLAFLPGYAAAWAGHFLIEKNRPATFQHPLWSFLADQKMLALMLTGKIEAEVERVMSESRRVDGETPQGGDT